MRSKRTTMSQYPIQRSMWESLDAILFSKGIALAKDIAAELNLPSKPLIASLNTQDRGKFVIIPDDEGHLYQCPALVQRGAVWMRCRCPTLKPAPSFCSAHERSPPDTNIDLPKVKRIMVGTDIFMVCGNDVLSLNGKHSGVIEDTRVTLFEIEEV